MPRASGMLLRVSELLSAKYTPLIGKRRRLASEEEKTCKDQTRWKPISEQTVW
jgi:hypothetical protein